MIGGGSYGNRRVYPLLALLYPGVNVRARFHEDHVFPKSRFTRRRLLEAGVPDSDIADYINKMNQLPNLQLLEGPVNVAKLAALPSAWARSVYPTPVERQAYLALHDLDGMPEDLSGFGDFYDRRRDRMGARLRALLVAPDVA